MISFVVLWNLSLSYFKKDLNLIRKNFKMKELFKILKFARNFCNPCRLFVTFMRRDCTGWPWTRPFIKRIFIFHGLSTIWFLEKLNPKNFVKTFFRQSKISFELTFQIFHNFVKLTDWKLLLCTQHLINRRPVPPLSGGPRFVSLSGFSSVCGPWIRILWNYVHIP